MDKEPDNLEIINTQDSEDKKNSKYIMNALKRENFQRNTIIKGLKSANSEDLIIVSDVDEIPNLFELNFKTIKDEIILFKQNFLFKFFKI